MTDGWGISWKIGVRWMPLDLTDDKSTLVQVMAWCRQATSHYLSQCWPRFMSPYGVTRPQWVKIHAQFPCQNHFRVHHTICSKLESLAVFSIILTSFGLQLPDQTFKREFAIWHHVSLFSCENLRFMSVSLYLKTDACFTTVGVKLFTSDPDFHLDVH